jgi:hypothetical protein
MPCCTVVRRVRTEKQIAESAAQQVSDAPLRQMVWSVVDQMAALAQASQVS